jgi:hypothetical protein
VDNLADGAFPIYTDCGASHAHVYGGVVALRRAEEVIPPPSHFDRWNVVILYIGPP